MHTFHSPTNFEYGGSIHHQYWMHKFPSHSNSLWDSKVPLPQQSWDEKITLPLNLGRHKFQLPPINLEMHKFKCPVPHIHLGIVTKINSFPNQCLGAYVPTPYNIGMKKYFRLQTLLIPNHLGLHQFSFPINLQMY